MSGGCFNYECHNVSNFADALEERLAINDCANGDHLKENDLENMWRCYRQIRRAADLAYAVEWSYSGDTGPDNVAEEMKKMGMNPLPSETAAELAAFREAKK